MTATVIIVRNERSLNNYIKNNRVSECCLPPNEQLLSYIMAGTCSNRLDDNDISFVRDQHA